MAFGQTFREALSDAILGAACQALNTWEFLANYNPLPAVDSALLEPWREFVRPYVCNLPAPEPPPQTSDDTFTGGQCDGVRYDMTWSYDQYTGTSTTCRTVLIGPFNQLAWGPIIGSKLQNAGDAGDFVAGCAGQTGYREVVITCRGFASTPGPLQDYVILSGSSPNIATSRITSVSRVDGQPDECGNPPTGPGTPPPSATNYDIDIEYTDGNNIDVTVPVGIIFAYPTLNVNGKLVIPFTLQLSPDIYIDGAINQDFDIDINIGSPGTPTNPPQIDRRDPGCDIPPTGGDDAPESPIPQPEDPPPSPEQDEVIIGAVVTVTEITPASVATLIVQDENPEIYVPKLGHINFLIRTGQTAAAWSQDIFVKNRRQIIECPWPKGAIAVRGTPENGVSWVITPIRSVIQPVVYPNRSF